jgi:hypothetical protein
MMHMETSMSLGDSQKSSACTSSKSAGDTHADAKKLAGLRVVNVRIDRVKNVPASWRRIPKVAIHRLGVPCQMRGGQCGEPQCWAE